MAADRAKVQADQLVQEAEKKLKSWAIFDRTAKYEDASELLKNAANQYKIAQEWELSAENYVRSADIAAKHLERQEFHVSDCYVQAAKAVKNVSLERSLELFKKAIDLEIAQNKFSIAARHCKEVAEMQERFEDFDDAIKYFQQAADCFNADAATTSALGCLAKVAYYTATKKQDFERAIALYEGATKSALENKQLHWMCTEYLFKASLCQLRIATNSGTPEKALEALENYCNMHPAFENSSECKFARDLATAVLSGKLEDFNKVLQVRNNIYPLDPFQVDLLLPVKEQLKLGAPGGLAVDPEIKVVGEGLEAEPDLM